MALFGDGYTVAGAGVGGATVCLLRFTKFLETFLPQSQNMNKLAEAETYRDRLNAREITLREVARAIGCSETYLSRYVSPTLTRSISTTKQRKNRRKLKETRQKHRKTLAIKVLKQEISLETAAKRAKCSIRTMYRYLQRAHEGHL